MFIHIKESNEPAALVSVPLIKSKFNQVCTTIISRENYLQVISGGLFSYQSLPLLAHKAPIMYSVIITATDWAEKSNQIEKGYQIRWNLDLGFVPNRRLRLKIKMVRMEWTSFFSNWKHAMATFWVYPSIRIIQTTSTRTELLSTFYSL